MAAVRQSFLPSPLPSSFRSFSVFKRCKKVGKNGGKISLEQAETRNQSSSHHHQRSIYTYYTKATSKLHSIWNSNVSNPLCKYVACLHLASGEPCCCCCFLSSYFNLAVDSYIRRLSVVLAHVHHRHAPPWLCYTLLKGVMVMMLR